MKIPSIVSNQSIKLLSGLGNNEDSLAAMAVKDWIGDGATVYTYKKEGGKDDAREKAIEEFGTGAIWLFGIPLVKKIIDKTVYPLFKISPELDPRILKDKDKINKIKEYLVNSGDEALKNQKQIFTTLMDKNPVLKKFTNEQMYKGLAIGKFLVSTIASTIALASIIRYKKTQTTNRIKEEMDANKKAKQQSILVKNSVNENSNFYAFTRRDKTHNLAFKGGLAEFMYNPIKNTMILDGVISGTRLSQARDGEKKEIVLKEAFQILFIYGLAKPIQKAFEFVGDKFKLPIQLDPKVLFSKNLYDNIKQSRGSMEQVKNSSNILKTLSEMDIKDPLIKLLDDDGVISTIKDKKGNILALDYLKTFDDDSVKHSIGNIEKLFSQISKIKSIKAYKAFAVIGNVLIAAGIMGILQPKINILMRKMLNHGDNRNPAIVEEERRALNVEAKSVGAHQG